MTVEVIRNTNSYIKREANDEVNIIGVFIFIVGLLSSGHIDVIGQLYISEVILSILFPLLLLRKGILLKNAWVKRIVIAGYLWFLGQVVSDLVHGTPLVDIARGWASILVFLISFMSLFMLLSMNQKRIMFFLFGYCVGGLFTLLIQPGVFFTSEPWKFGYGPVLTLFLLLVITYMQNRKTINQGRWIILLVCLGSFSFYSGARSLGAATLLTAIIVVFVNSKNGIRFFKKKLNLGKVGLLVLLFVGLLIGIERIYGMAANQGLLGETAKNKYEIQSSGKFGLILGGRAEIVPSLHAVMDSPVIGHGSWAKDTKYRLDFFMLTRLGYSYSIDQIEYTIGLTDLIPAHSHLLQNWVWAGILGAYFWIVVFVLVCKSLLHSIRSLNPFYILIIYLSISSIWSILFSPFGGEMRLQWVLQLVIFITSLYLPGREAQFTQKD